MQTISITKVLPVKNFHLHLFFSNGENGIIDMHKYLWGEAFKELKDPQYFQKVTINKDIGTISWSNGIDIAPESLYADMQAL